MDLHQVTNMVTDYTLAALTALMGAILIRRTAVNLAVRLWGIAFVALAIAGVAGGTYHGTVSFVGERTQMALWRANLYGIGVFGFASVAGTILAAFVVQSRAALAVAAVGGYLAYVVWITLNDDFLNVIYFDSAVMLIVLVIQAWTYFTRRDPASLWIFTGIVVSVAAAFVQRTEATVGGILDHNDIFHLVQLVGMYLLFRGARLLGMSPPLPFPATIP